MTRPRNSRSASRSADTHSVGLVVRAAAFAAHKHRDQRRKDRDASPYINHPIALAEVLVEEGGIKDSTTLAVALLHDTIEDTQTSYDELRGLFGEPIADAVVEVTDVQFVGKIARKRLQVARAGSASLVARRVKLADKICNLRDLLGSPPRDWSLERKREYFDWAKSVVDQLRGTNVRLERAFDQVVRQRP